MGAHAVGWIVLTVLSFLQVPGRTAADTKFDLTANPAGFLAQSIHAYTDTFTLGQIQNQAYGYLFPHGLFFLVTEPLPDWVAQRLWWAIVMGVGFSGTLELARRIGLGGARGGSGAAVWVPALLYALSPRIMTTLTAISSEAWPVALVPWTLLPLVGGRIERRDVAAAVIPVALMGAVNATATMMACLPTFVLLVYRLRWRALLGWLAGVALVSAWWIGPLLVLGRYSPPFTDFIESSYVTTRWLNLAEILRGTTSWVPFVDAERVSGHLLVTEPVFVLATLGVGAVGVAGLAQKSMPWRGYFVLLLCLGVALMGAAHGPVGGAWLDVLDGALAPFRNLHKLDPLVRLPLVLGVGHAIAQASERLHNPALVAVGLVAVVATAPAWSLRLAPEGTWTEVSSDWEAAADYIDHHAAGTRTLVVPEASFARQTWGWTRDEPIQAITSTRFAARDAIPLVDPEAIRGLDGQMAALDPEAMRAIGAGAVVVRDDLQDGQGPPAPELDREKFGEPEVFGDLQVYLIEPARDMMIGAQPVTVDGGGEVLPLLDREFGYSPRELVGGPGAEIVTDTPAMAVRNYGTLDGPVSAHLADESEGGDIRNAVPDYPSVGQRVRAAERGGHVEASSSAADATSFGGAEPAKSLTAAVDGLDSTAWHPAPGDTEAWLEVHASNPPGEFTLTVTRDTTVTWSDGVNGGSLEVEEGVPVSVDTHGSRVRIELSEPAGISELDFGVRRIVAVEGTGDTYFFQRLQPATDVIHREFTTKDAGTWELSRDAIVDGEPRAAGPVELAAGTHTLVTEAETVSLTRGYRAGTWEPFDGTVAPSGSERVIITTRAFNEGLRARVGGVTLEPMRIDAGMQAFRLPPSVSGTFEMTFAGSTFFQASLIFGGVVSLLTLAGCLLLDSGPRARRGTFAGPRANVAAATAATAGTAVLVAGLPGAAAFAATLLVRRITLIPDWALGGGAVAVMGLWLARAPWPAANYAGDSLAIALAGCVAIACLAGRSTNS